ncbi:hypothetical protein PLESTB_001754900 [Pleodorina starrii]|uniref:ubiquitinyl hydrolase 1 n=1 Tax=Pleodorina starrii TaxID=330485 RepID=A0A9W6F9I3_9CHLO|nr:hypothetical protein PLESTM_000596600 [Pleodorina starrii]GLC61422.1 hypothetical protein PLESTB_001754900 [Pleodorina starrii]
MIFVAIIVFFLFIWLLCVAATGIWRQSGIMHGVPGGNVWTRRAAAMETNWWESVNSRKPEEHDLAATPGVVDGNSAAPPAVPHCVCLQCGVLIPQPPKTCGSCKLAAYCSKDCQRQHWQRHKPQCARLLQAARERAAKGQPRPPPPTPDPPLQLPTSAGQLVFSRDHYRTLLGAHQVGRQAAAATTATAAAAASAGVHPSDAPDGGADGGAAQQRQGQRQGQSPELESRESASPSSSSSSLAATTTSSTCSAAAAGAAATSSASSPLSDSPSPSSAASSGLSDGQQQQQPRKQSATLEASEPEAQPQSSPAHSPSPSPSYPWPRSWPPPPASPALLTPPRPAGILNTGNTCYVASAVQALLATPGLGEYLRSGVHCRDCPAPEELAPGVSSWCPACELCRLAAAAAASVATKTATPAAADGCPAASNGGPGPSSCPTPAPAPSAWGAAAAAAASRVWPWSQAPRGPAAAAALDARGLTRNVGRLGRTLVPGRQEDAHELLVQLLEALAEVQLAEAGGKGLLRARAARRAAEQQAAAAAAAAKRRKVQQQHQGEEEEEEEERHSSSNGVAPKPVAPAPAPAVAARVEESTLVHQVLGGYLRRATLCNCCGHVSQSHEPVLGLQVDLGPRVGSVEAGLRASFADEVLGQGNEYRCERCRQLVCATRRVRLEVAPNALAIHLKRFAAGPGSGAPAGHPGGWGPWTGKDARPISLRMDLDLTPYMAPEAVDPGPALYRLYGVVQHMGIVPPGAQGGGPAPQALHMHMSMHMGHYVAVVRGADGAWYRCDDDEVQTVSESEVESIKDAYVLFYERLHPFIPVGAGGGPGQDAEVGEEALQAPQQQQQDQEQEQEQVQEQEQQGKENEEQVAAEGEGAGVEVCGSGAWASSVETRPELKQEQLQEQQQQQQQDSRHKQEPHVNGTSLEQAGVDRAAKREADEEGPPADAVTAGAAAEAAALPQPSLPQPTDPCWSTWLQADAAPPQAGTAPGKAAPAAAAPTAAVVCPSGRLRRLRPAARGAFAEGALEQRWVLRIHMPGVKAARDVRMAVTCPPLSLPPVQPFPASGSGGAGAGTSTSDGLRQVAGRVRVWVVNSYNFDVQLALQRQWQQRGAGAGEGWQLSVVGWEEPAEAQVQAVSEVGAGGEAVGAASAVAVEVLQPRWAPTSCTLHVPLRLRL